MAAAPAGLLVLCAAIVLGINTLRSPNGAGRETTPLAIGAPPASPPGSESDLSKGAVDLLVNLDAAAASVKGSWTRQGADLVSDSSGPAILELPVRPPREYDFRIEFTPQDCVEQLLFAPSGAAGARGVAFNWCMGVGEVCGFESLNGAHVFDPSSPLTRHWVLRPGVRHVSVVQVRKDGIRATVDGELVIEWKTDYHDLGRLEEWSMGGNDRLGLGTWNKPTHFHKAELVDRTATKGQ